MGEQEFVLLTQLLRTHHLGAGRGSVVNIPEEGPRHIVFRNSADPPGHQQYHRQGSPLRSAVVGKPRGTC